MLKRLVVVLGVLVLPGCGDGITGPGEPAIDLTVHGRVVSAAGAAVLDAEVFLFAGSHWSGEGVAQVRDRTGADGSFSLRVRAQCQNPRMTVRVWGDEGMSEWSTGQTPEVFDRTIRCTSDAQEIMVTVD